MLIEETLEKFLGEDIGHGDITTDALVDSRTKATGQVVCKERAVIAGLSESIIILKLLDCKGKLRVRDGQEVSAGTVILEVDGSGNSLLKVAGSITESVRKSKAKVSFTKKIEVEATSPNQAVEAARAGADIVLLDNMTPQEVKKSLDLLGAKKLRGHILVEVSGGITRNNLASYVKTGVDVISVGSITHSAKAIDMNLELHSLKK